jgi:RNA-directed DNA polymerase
VARLKESLRTLTRRTRGQSLPCIVAGVNRRLRGWAGYFRGGVLNVHRDLDRWVRGRLRSLLRKRDRRKGRGRGFDHHRYPTVYFAEHGLISLKALAGVERPSPA